MTARGRLLAHLILSRISRTPDLPWQETVSSVLREELGRADPGIVQLILSALPSPDPANHTETAAFARFLSAQLFPTTANFQRTAHSFGPSGHHQYRKA